MNIKTLDTRLTVPSRIVNNKGGSRGGNSGGGQYYQDNMNYNHGFSGEGGPHPHPHPGGPPYSHPGWHYDPAYMQYDQYGNPIGGGGGGGGGYQYPGYPQQAYPAYQPPHPQDSYGHPPHGYPPQGIPPGPGSGGGQEFVRRDPHGPVPSQLLSQPQPQYSSTGGSRPPEERVLRNPHPPTVITSSGGGGQGGGQSQGSSASNAREELYDPNLPTYNATPIYQNQFPAAQQKTIVAPTLKSIFEIAAEQVSKKIEQQQQQLLQQERSSSSSTLAPTPASASASSSRLVGVAPGPASESRPAATTASSKNAYPFPATGPGSLLESHTEGPTEIITGLVTQMQDMFGMVSGEIFFQTSTVVGALPSVGDKVVVEAERVSGMPFKFNGKRVQLLSKDLISSDVNSGASRQQQNRDEKEDFDFERRSRRPSSSRTDEFGTLPSMPNSLNLFSPSNDGLRGVGPSQTPPPLKSILKRNPPPPPMLSNRAHSKQSGGMEGKYRPESPVEVDGYQNQRGQPQPQPLNFGSIRSGDGGSFSLDLRNEFPVINQPSGKTLMSIQDLYPELLYVKNTGEVEVEIEGNAEIMTEQEKEMARRRSRSRSRTRSISRRRTSRDRILKKHRRSNSRSRSRSPLPSNIRKSINSRRRSSRSISPEARRKHRSPISPLMQRKIRSRSTSPVLRRGRKARSRSRSKSPRATGRSRRSSRSPVKKGFRTQKRSPPIPVRKDRGATATTTSRRKSRSKTPSKRPHRRESNVSSSRSSRSGEDEEIRILNEPGNPQRTMTDQDDGGLNPFGDDSEIKAVVVSSTLFPRIKKKDNDQSGHLSNPRVPIKANAATAKKIVTRPPPNPIKFHIGGPVPAPVPAPKLVPNPAFAPSAFHQFSSPTLRSSGPSSSNSKGGTVILLQNPAYTSPTSMSTPTSNANPSAVVASVERAIIKAGKKKKEYDQAQAPAYVLMDQKETPSNNGGGGGGNSSVMMKERLETLEEQQMRRINELKESLHAQKMAQIQEQERFLLDQKAALEMELNNAKTLRSEHLRVTTLQLQKSVESKLKGLRQNWDECQSRGNNENDVGVGGNGMMIIPDPVQEPQQQSQRNSPQEDKIREAIHYEKFLDEERRLKLAGDTFGLSQLYKMEDRRRRHAEEERLDNLRLEEIRLKKDKNWTGLKTLRESFGGTVEREMELMRLREVRNKEEMDRANQEEELHRRNHMNDFNVTITERSQRGSEGPVRRVEITKMRQLSMAEIELIKAGGDLGIKPRRVRTPSPPTRIRRTRTRSRSRGRVPNPSRRSVERSRRKSPPKRASRSSRRPSRDRVARSRSRDRGGGRGRGRIPVRGRRSRSSSLRPRSRNNEQDLNGRRSGSHNRDHYQETEAAQRRAVTAMDDREQAMMAQMEQMRRQEEELLLREREIHARMEMMQHEQGQYFDGPQVQLVHEMHPHEMYHHHHQMGHASPEVDVRYVERNRRY